MRLIALDLSLTASGVCLPDSTTRTIRTKLTGMERLARIRADVIALANGEQAPDLVVIEGYSYNSKGNSAVSLGELGGIIRMWLWDREFPYVEIPPACRCKFATGKGNASKDLVLQEAVHRSGRVFGDNNEADAWWLWCMAMAHYCPGDPRVPVMPQANREGLERVRWIGMGRNNG